MTGPAALIPPDTGQVAQGKRPQRGACAVHLAPSRVPVAAGGE